MIRGRRSLRNIGKSGADCRDRINRIIRDEDWECTSEEEVDSDEEQQVDDTSGSTRSSVKRVASVIAKFDEKKKELVRSIGFGGLLELNQINKVSRTFTVWLLSRLDTDNRTIDVNGEIQVEMVDFDVNRILGIPCGPRVVSPLQSDDAKTKKFFMQQLIGASPSETNSLLAAGRVVSNEYGGKMTKKQCDNFKVAFVVFVVGHLLAPTCKNNVGNTNFWGALTRPDEISQFNWSEYVLEQLVEAAAKVQADIRNKKKLNNITGCSILIQIMYLETLNIPGIEHPRDAYPRIKAYTCSYLSKMIEADKATSSGGTSKPTWGRTIIRRVPATNVGADEASLLERLGQAGDIREELSEFAKDNFSGKMTETHINALIAYGERCTTHFNTLKQNLMKENLFLVEMLMCGRANAPMHNLVPACHPTSSGNMRSGQGAGRTDMRSLRGYDSECEGSRRGTRSASSASKQHMVVDTLLTGTTVGSDFGSPINSNQDVAGTSHTTAGNENELPLEIGVHKAFEPQVFSKKVTNVLHHQPSFDLGIDFDTVDKGTRAEDIIAEQRNNSRGKSPVSRQEDADLDKLEEDRVTNSLHDGMGFVYLGHTPASGKRKSDPMSSTSAEQRLKTLTTSPASMSKILADGVVFARIVQSEDELNMNIQPWDHDTTDSPVTKQSMDTTKLVKSPWFHGLKQKLCTMDIAESTWQQVMNLDRAELQRPWIIHRYPRFLEVTGSCIKDSFTLKEPFDYDLYDLALRRLVQLDTIMYKDANGKRWRHIFESDFAVLSQANDNPAYHKTIREQFYGPGVKYKLSNCRMLIIPAQVLRNWCCYFWDFKKKVIHIVDPLYKEEQSAYYQKLHGPIVDKIGADLANCIDLFFENWSIIWNEWKQEFVVPMITLSNCKESAILSLMSITDFDGEGFKTISEASFKEFKKLLLAEILAILDNQANPPVKYNSEKRSSPIIHAIDID